MSGRWGYLIPIFVIYALLIVINAVVMVILGTYEYIYNNLTFRIVIAGYIAFGIALIFGIVYRKYPIAKYRAVLAIALSLVLVFIQAVMASLSRLAIIRYITVTPLDVVCSYLMYVLATVIVITISIKLFRR